MAITFVNKGTWAAGTTSISPGIPASMQAGDFMILQVHTCNQAVTTPSGWTAITSSPVSTGTANTAGGTRISAYYRWWQSGDVAPTVAVTGGTVTNGIIVGYRGVDPTTPFDATPVADVLATASATLTMTGITTVTANALIHWAIARDQDANSTTAVTAFTNANLTDITETHDQVVSTGVGGGIWTGRGFKATAGATGNTTITQTSSIAVGLTIALRPAPNNYPLTAQGGSYSATGASANLTYTSLKPTIISTVALSLGTSANPGAQSITVPSDAQIVIVQATTYVSGGATLSITSDFSGTFTTTTAGDGSDKCHVGYAVVSSTGSKTITPTWSTTLTDGPLFIISFIKGVNTSDFLRQSLPINWNTQGSTVNTTISSSATDLVLILERQAATTTPPTLESGCTSVTTQGINNLGGRLQYTNSPGSSTTTITSTGTEFPGFAAISIKQGTSSNAYTITAQGGNYSLTGSPANIFRNRVLTSQGGSYTISGQDIVITWTGTATAYNLICQGGSYSLTGSSVNVFRNRTLSATGGVYTSIGSSATISKSKVIVAQGGSYSLNGQSITLSRNRLLVVNGGSYSITGNTATITWATAGGAVWPSPSLVLLGTVYGPTGSEYTGTLDLFGIKYDITTGQLVKPINDKVVMTL